MSNVNCPNCGATLSLAVAGDPAPVVQPPVERPPVAATSYPVSKLVAADKMYLWKMEQAYRVALKSLPGSHQLFWEVLTDNFGHRWSDGVPQPAGTVNSPALNQAINLAINAGASDAALPSFLVSAYNGPLRAIYANLVAAKLAGK